MKIVYSTILPFKGFLAINLFGIVFVRKERRDRFGIKAAHHEAIHTAQMKELGYIGFYIVYLLEWLYRLVFHTRTAYKGISFEREAYEHEAEWVWNYQKDWAWESRYLPQRKPFAQWKRKAGL